ncbi:MAG: hypothetical protein ACC642_09735 [Pseudomonadales bacterium]
MSADGPGVWIASVEGDQDEAARTIAAAVIGGAHPLFELRLLRRDLETVFREVNEEPAEEVQHAA